ncbi:hypothetical protein FRB97_009766 [Tulasnella sp. 331]|nr:hypothetical protein FRB97_009766 [Tulasnella sp. 331]
MRKNDPFDVIIVGGGVAGCSTALSLLRSNPRASFAVIDNADFNSFKIGESLPAEAKRILHYLTPSIPDRLSQDTAAGVHITCSGNASVWESMELHETFALMNPFGSGWHLNRAAFDEMLREHVRKVCPSEADEPQRLLIKGTFAAIRKDEHGRWIVTTRKSNDSKEQQEYRSTWLIDASGRQASVAHKLGAKVVKLDRLLAVYGVFSSPNLDRDRRTVIEATEDGWWYTSQLANQQRVIAFHTDDCDPVAKRARHRDGFLDLLHQTTTHISNILELNDWRLISGRGHALPRCIAAGSSFLEPLGDEHERWCAVGDAAAAFDPLSSQGIITALRMGCSVGIMISKQLQLSQSPDLDKPVETGSSDLNSVKRVYLRIREDYEKKRRYFYDQSMFSSDFWLRRRERST